MNYPLRTLVTLLFIGVACADAAGPSVVIAGYDSDNVVQFDLASGRWTEIARLRKKSQPRGITVGEGGEIYVGLHGGKKNLVKVTPGKDSSVMTDVTGSIGQFGPGILVAGKGKIWAAGDTDRVIYQIDPANGSVLAPAQYRNCCNLVGLAASGDALYAAEYFQRSILRYDLTSEPAVAVRFIEKSEHLNRPVGLVIAHNGNLLVANGLVPTIVEFNIKTGEYVRTFVDLGMAGKEGIHGVVYVPEMKRYYIASGSSLHETDEQGTLTATYNSPALKKAYGIAFIPGRATLTLSGGQPGVPGSATSAVAPAIAHQRVTLLTMSPRTPGRLSIAGAPGMRYRVMATTDFLTWDPIGEVQSTGDLAEFIDADAGRFDKRFYRLEVVGAESK